MVFIIITLVIISIVSLSYSMKIYDQILNLAANLDIEISKTCMEVLELHFDLNKHNKNKKIIDYLNTNKHGVDDLATLYKKYKHVHFLARVSLGTLFGLAIVIVFT